MTRCAIFSTSPKRLRALLVVLVCVVGVGLLITHRKRISVLKKAFPSLPFNLSLPYDLISKTSKHLFKFSKPSLQDSIRDVETLPWIKKLGVHNNTVSTTDIYLLNKNISSPPSYQDPHFLKSCAVRRRTRELSFHILKIWMKIAAEHNITWFLVCGSNIGSLRHRDFIPWDRDLDIGVFDVDEALIRRLAVKKHRTMNRSRPNLVTRVKDFCPQYYWDRRDCQDSMVKSQVDRCAFCGPLARLLYKTAYMDIFLLQRKSIKGEVVFLDQSFDSPRTLPVSTYFPLQLCKFIGLTVPCANKREEYAKIYYGDIRPSSVCKGSTWQSVKYNNSKRGWSTNR